MMLHKALDHSVAIGVANRVRGIDDHCADLGRSFQAIEDFATFAHGNKLAPGDPQPRVTGFGAGSSNFEPPRPKTSPNPVKNRAFSAARSGHCAVPPDVP